MTVRIGEISYTNILPIFYFTDRKMLMEKGFTFIPQVPAELNRAMKSKEIDVGGISSFAYGQNQEDYTLLPQLSVSSLGEVGSLFLFSKKPIEQLNHSKIALTNSSATTIHLLKVILAHFYEFDMKYDMCEPNYETMLSEYEACLLIGDDAIKAAWRNEPGIYQYDLGELWYEKTGLPMTFAVMAVRNEVIEKQFEDIELLYRQFCYSKEYAQQTQFEPMIEAILQAHDGSIDFWRKYFQGLTYEFTEKEQQGLLYYYQLCYQLGFLDKPVDDLRIFQPKKDKMTK
ncbi:menaquinone biosynthesis protein [Alkalihalobacillus pseudalcaliphilus]|uniref:menaquinone biosynthesis protein n=1 Tax=Alkalihalobacillus pseudalcaliphilus TaxID=79884 RepID=UPI00064D8C77|nr:menaquinone biosynthesis protein [Alkalihalobacillus pseudalcaliphilus]KMK76444.1 hypothetical protein AB990_14750 [Alkalihalobacillus pseudalcaliphilus]